MSPLLERLLAAAAASLLGIAVAGAQVYIEEEEEEFSNSAFVRVSEEVNADLFLADLKAREGDWSAAVNAYQRVLDREEHAVVEFGPRLYVSGKEAARRRLAALPPGARARYVDLFEAKAEAARRQALRLFDAPRLLRVAERYPLTVAAEQALSEAAAVAAEQGRRAEVTRALDRMFQRDGAGPADVARYAQVLAAAGDGAALAALRDRVADRRDEPVDIGGVPRALGAVLDELVAGAGGTLAPERAAALATGPLRIGMQVRLPFEERNQTPRELPDPLGYTAVTFPAIGGARQGGVLWVAGQAGIYRLGESGEAPPPLVRYQRDLGLNPEYQQVSSRSLDLLEVGPWLYLVLNERSHSYDGEESGRLVGIDAASGTVAMQVRPDDLQDGAFAGYVLEGPPARYGDLLLVAGSRLGATTECSLFAFAEQSGALVWSRFLASAAKVSRYDARNRKITAERAAPSAVTVADGVAYCVTNLGIVAAVDAATGDVHWLFRYNRLKPTDPERYRRAALYDTGGWHQAPPFILGDRVIVTPEDSRFLYVLGRQPSPAGHLRLADPTFKAEYEVLIGVDPAAERLLIVKQNVIGHPRSRIQLVATNLDGGLIAESVPFEVEERLTGRPVRVLRTLFVPTSKALYRLDLDTGLRVRDFLPVPEALLRAGERRVYGNLELDDGLLTSISPVVALEVVPAE